MKLNQSPDKHIIALQWAGLPIEYWIDLNIHEGGTACHTMGELCDKFPQQSRDFHISLISERLIHLAQINEIGFMFGTWGNETELTVEEGLARLKLADTWECDEMDEEELRFFFTELSFRQRLSILWDRIKGKPYTGRYSSVPRGTNPWP